MFPTTSLPAKICDTIIPNGFSGGLVGIKPHDDVSEPRLKAVSKF